MGTHKIFLILNLGLVLFDSAAQMLFMSFMYPYIVVIQIDQRSFFVGCEKVILPVVVGPFEWLYCTIVEGLGSEVSSTRMPIF